MIVGGDFMITSLLITFRESLEIYIFILPLIIYMYKIGKPQESKRIYLGLATGLLLTVLTGIGLNMFFSTLEGGAMDLVEAGLQLFLSMLIIYALVILQNLNKNYDFLKVDENISIKSTSLYILALITVFREGLEVVVFTLPNIITSPILTISGMFIGIAVSTIIMLLMFKTTIKININIIFVFSALFLIYIGAECFGEALMYFFPNLGLTVMAGEILYALPMLYLFIKAQLKRYIKKNIK